MIMLGIICDQIRSTEYFHYTTHPLLACCRIRAPKHQLLDYKIGFAMGSVSRLSLLEEDVHPENNR